MLYSIQRITAPTEQELETLCPMERLRTHLGLNTEDDDDLLTIYRAAAYASFETETDWCVMLTTVFRQWLPEWDRQIRLERGNVLEVNKVAYFDSDGAEQELDLEDVGVDLTGTPAYVYPGEEPDVSTEVNRPVYVEFTCGWAEAEDSGGDFPNDVRLYVLLLASHYYANRESFTTDNLLEVPQGCKRIADHYRTPLGDTF